MEEAVSSGIILGSEENSACAVNSAEISMSIFFSYVWTDFVLP